jgi:AcrR family transcriptional regulator
MTGKSSRTDRRTQRTRRQLSIALNELIKEKRFNDITVQNVIERADVGRATFYSHFRDKEDLFEQQWQRGMQQLAEQIDWNRAGKDSFFPAASFFQHLLDVQPFYRGLVRSGKIDAIFKSGVEYLSRYIESSLTERMTQAAGKNSVKHRGADQPMESVSAHNKSSRLGIADTLRLNINQRQAKARPVTIPIPIFANYIASEFFALLKWWLDTGMRDTPENMDEMFHRLINPTVKSALE